MANWNTMIEYLKVQDSCSVHGEYFYVENLSTFIHKMESNIRHFPNEERKINKYCKSLKGSLTKVYEAHKKGLVKRPYERPVKYFSSFK